MFDVTDPPSELDNTDDRAIASDDILLIPQYSEIESSSEVDLSNYLGDYKLDIPIIASPMSTIGGAEMCVAMREAGGLGIVHRYMSIDKQSEILFEIADILEDNEAPLAAAIGVTGDFKERARRLVGQFVDIICIDVAHGHHILVKKAIEHLREEYGDQIHIMAGNVATPAAVFDLAVWGADSIRVGVGGGSICSTRTNTGHGVPLLQSIFDINEAFGILNSEAMEEKMSDLFDETQQRIINDPPVLIADGGVRSAGDILKLIAAGADLVMCGSIVSGTDECPGRVIQTNDGLKYKEYEGMASYEAQIKWRGTSSAPEGIAVHVPYKGPLAPILADLKGNMQRGLSYSGAKSIDEFQEVSEFILQTPASQVEGTTHIRRVI